MAFVPLGCLLEGVPCPWGSTDTPRPGHWGPEPLVGWKWKGEVTRHQLPPASGPDGLLNLPSHPDLAFAEGLTHISEYPGGQGLWEPGGLPP